MTTLLTEALDIKPIVKLKLGSHVLPCVVDHVHILPAVIVWAPGHHAALVQDGVYF